MTGFFLALIENANSMMDVEGTDDVKSVLRRGFMPKHKISPEPIKYNNQNHSKEELKIDKERKMPYYGKNISELPPIEKSSGPIREDERKVVFPLIPPQETVIFS